MGAADAVAVTVVAVTGWAEAAEAVGGIDTGIATAGVDLVETTDATVVAVAGHDTAGAAPAAAGMAMLAI